MCDQIEHLSFLDDFRWIAICEHGTIHLAWNHMLLFLQPQELNQLGVVLDCAVTEREHARNQGAWSTQTAGQFTLSIAEYALRLQPLDFLLFGSMVSQATGKLPSRRMRATTLEITVVESTEGADTLLADPDRFSFSLN